MSTFYAVREATAAFRRAPLLVLLSVLAIAFSLFVLGLFALTTHNIQRALERIEERVEIVAYLRDDAPPEAIRWMERELAAQPEVLRVRYVSKLEALAKALREMAEFRELYEDLETNPLPASLEIRLRPGHRDPATVARIARLLQSYPTVEDVRFGRDWLEKVTLLRRLAAGFAAALGGALALVGAIIIAAAIRVAVFARRNEIAIMRLVGATDGFIEAPFVLEGLAVGLAGGCLALGLTVLAYRIVTAALVPLEWIPDAWVVAGLGAGALFGLASSAIAVRRHLRAA